MSEQPPSFAADQAVSTADENALLRASLADAQARIRELEALVETDPLTGLGNRRRFESALERVVGVAERHGAASAVLLVAVEGLAKIEERHGRFAADAALRHVAGLLSGLIRATDMVARVDEDRFALILDHLDHNSAIDTAERIERCIAADPVDLGPSVVAVKAVVAATCILPGDAAGEVMLRLGRNLEAARAQG
ncbi:MAG: GGDEF domain-containing protein [Allosphingosinicella sp.]